MFVLQEDANFIVVDWSIGASNTNYYVAKNSAHNTGKEIAKFLQWLDTEYDLNYADIHIISHSLGCQVAGAVGRAVGDSEIRRITGINFTSDSTFRENLSILSLRGELTLRYSGKNKGVIRRH